MVRLTSYNMFVSGNFLDKSPAWFLKNLKLPSFYSGNFKIFKNALGSMIHLRRNQILDLHMQKLKIIPETK